jgi:DICT domain-containing protein
VLGSLNWDPPVVDQTTVTTPAVSHPTATTVEEFRRLLDQRAVQPGADARRRFDVVVTHDRELVIAAAEPLLRRLDPER